MESEYKSNDYFILTNTYDRAVLVAKVFKNSKENTHEIMGEKIIKDNNKYNFYYRVYELDRGLSIIDQYLISEECLNKFFNGFGALLVESPFKKEEIEHDF